MEKQNYEMREQYKGSLTERLRDVGTCVRQHATISAAAFNTIAGSLLGYEMVPKYIENPTLENIALSVIGLGVALVGASGVYSMLSELNE